MSRSFGIVVAVVLIAFAIYYPYSPGVRQRANMKLAEQHIATLTPQIAGDPRFARVELHAATSRGGSLASSATSRPPPIGKRSNA